MTAPRYVLRESSGNKIVPPDGSRRESRVTEWLIMDTWYCYEVVWAWRGWRVKSGRQAGNVYGSVQKRRLHARVMLARLNQEHESWLRETA